MAGNVIPYQPPLAEVPGPFGAPAVQPFTAHAHCNQWDIVTVGTVTAGQIDPAGDDPAGSIAGIAQMDSQAVFQQDDSGIQAVFGADNVNTGLLPAEPGQTLVVVFDPAIPVEINLSATTGWISGGSQQATIGTQVGLALDSTSGFYYADPTASNKVATVVQKAEGPTSTLTGASNSTIGYGGVGDLGARVFIKFLATALAPTGGGVGA